MIKSVRETCIPGCLEIEIQQFEDLRGRFIKTFHADEFREHGIDFQILEQYYSVSHKNVLRGLHFQEPPYGQAKLVACAAGSFLDVAVDVRPDSPAYGKFETFRLEGGGGCMVLLPVGCAHGFLALENDSVMLCHLSSVFNARADGGVRYDSVGIDWGGGELILSEKDRNLPRLQEYQSPFRMTPQEERT